MRVFNPLRRGNHPCRSLIEQINGLPIPKLDDWNRNYEAERLYRKARALNPAYEPEYTEELARQTEEALPARTTLDRSCSLIDERPVRDLSFLRFCRQSKSFTAAPPR